MAELALKVEKEFLTSREAALMLGVALSTVQLWTENGILRAWKTSGGHRRIARNSVETLLIEQRAVIDNVSLDSTSADTALEIVVVEDEPLIVQLYQAQLLAWEFNLNLITATNGFDGLMQIGRCSPDVIITDLVMPDMDGFQMINALKRFPILESCLIVVVSILSEQEIQEKGLFTKDNIVFFQKPVPFEEIKNLISKRIVIQEKTK